MLQIKQNLSKKYMTSKDFYNVKIINDIIYNENTHIVSVFKDYLILDDISEFLKRSYTSFETKPRLVKIYEFYDKYSKVYPNYISLPESKYMYKNIERKQRMIDERQQYIQNKEKKAKKEQKKQEKKTFGEFSDLLDSSESLEKMFDTKFIDSVNKIVPVKPLDMSNQTISSRLSQLEDHKMQASAISEHSQINKTNQSSNWERIQEICNESGFQNKPSSEIPLEQLVENFIDNDSQVLSSNLSLDHSMKLETPSKNISDINPNDKSKRKVKKVDYVLKLTSNEIERKAPSLAVNKVKKPSNYKIDPQNYAKAKKYEIVTKPDKYLRYKNDNLKNKKLKNKEIFGNSNKHMLNTQRYEKLSYNSSK